VDGGVRLVQRRLGLRARAGVEEGGLGRLDHREHASRPRTTSSPTSTGERRVVPVLGAVTR
jgi:hypothetical protein